ncbi:hypothetical protein B484DRAFT_225961 [Ochromonadaceae sp. CCMP2298]|nr:hypothetical protein B484DRAFT_225961 [Ochromonadaceae sp. CCMP2298]
MSHESEHCRTSAHPSSSRRALMAWLFLALLSAQVAVGQNLEPIVKSLGAQGQIPRKWFNLCGEPSCNWDAGGFAPLLLLTAGLYGCGGRAQGFPLVLLLTAGL